MNPAYDSEVSVNGVRLHFREWPNSGAPTLLLTQAWPSSVLVWEPFAAAMRDRFRVLALDVRGHGDSEWAADYRWQTVMEDVGRFLAGRAAAPVAIVGHGGGGILALCFAAIHPAAVRRVVNVDQMPQPADVGGAARLFPETFKDPEEPVRILAERHWAAGAGVDVLRAAMRLSLRQLEDGRWTWRRDPEIVAALMRRELIPDEQECSSLFAQIRCPALLVRGADSFGGREAFDRAAAIIPDARVVEVARSRHLPHLSNPAGFVAAVRPFLLNETDTKQG